MRAPRQAAAGGACSCGCENFLCISTTPACHPRLPQWLPVVYGAIVSPLRLAYHVVGASGMERLDSVLAISDWGHNHGAAYVPLAYAAATAACAASSWALLRARRGASVS